jgi:hypothetical protein
MIDEELGQNFPYFASVGNHELDGPAWAQEGGYRDLLENRASVSISNASCSRIISRNQSCTSLAV